MNNGTIEKNLLFYGECVVDESFTLEGIHDAIRIRVIKLNDNLYYHKMIARKVVEVKFLGCEKSDKNDNIIYNNGYNI